VGHLAWKVLTKDHLFIYLFIHHTACSPQAMAGEVQTNNPEQEQQMKPNKGKTKNPWLGSTAPQSPVTPALVTKKFSRNHSGL
jgi:hypothetical protein